MTLKIRSAVVQAILDGKQPVLVTIGSHAFSSNFNRLSLWCRLLSRSYGDIKIVVRLLQRTITDIDRNGHGSIVSHRLDDRPEFSLGVFGSRELGDAFGEAILPERVESFKDCLTEIMEGDNAISSSSGKLNRSRRRRTKRGLGNSVEP